MTKLREVEARVRAALGAGRLDDASGLVMEYRRAFDEAWTAMSGSERKASELPGEAAALLHWAIAMSKVLRELTAERLRNLRTLKPYRTGPGRRVKTWQCKG